jgi:hypothetical protein
LTVDSPPYDGPTPLWNVEDGQFDLVITSLAYSPYDVCEHLFDGTDLDGSAYLPAQPTLTLRGSDICAKDILGFIAESVDAGTLEGNGSGNSGPKRLEALIHMIESAGKLIDYGEVERACDELRAAYDKCDGLPKPPDFVAGTACPELAAMIQQLIAGLC